MKTAKLVRRTLLLGAVATVAMAPVLLAQTSGRPTIAVHEAWSRPANIGANGAGYMAIANTGSSADRLTAAESPVAVTVTLHQTQTVGGVTSMRPVDGIPIRAGQTVVLAPGGFHLMLEGLRRPLKVGDHVPVALTFAKSGAVRAELVVRAAAPQAMSDMKM